MNPKIKFALILAAVFVAGRAYGSKIGIVNTVASKLPGAGL